VLWRSDADCAALFSLSLFAHVCCYGACHASPTTRLPSANNSISTWLASSSALAFSLIVHCDRLVRLHGLYI
jgi:hypothetical protein